MLHPSDVHPQQKSRLGLLFLISRHPLMVLGLGWGIIMVAAAFGLATLVSPGGRSPQAEVFPSVSSPSDPINPPATPESSPSPDTQPEASLPVFTTPSQPSEPERTGDTAVLPLWTFGAIAISCAAGSLLLTLALKQASGEAKRQQQAQKRPKKRSTPSFPRRGSQRAPSPPQRSNGEPQVTILPPELSHPLDTGQEDLASEMDLRRRHSLSSLLRDF